MYFYRQALYIDFHDSFFPVGTLQLLLAIYYLHAVSTKRKYTLAAKPSTQRPGPGTRGKAGGTTHP